MDVMDVGIYGYQDPSDSDEVPDERNDSKSGREDINVRAWGVVLLVSCVILFSLFLRTSF